MTVKIVTDSLADLPTDLIQALGISVIPLTVNFGFESFRDGVDIDSQQFFARLISGATTPKTSQPSVGDFAEVYAKLTSGGNDILSIHASGKLSGTINSATQASQDVQGVGIQVIDTLSASLGEGLVVLAAARLANSGASLDAVADAAQKAASKLNIYFVLDTLEYLQKGGRIGKAQQLFGTLLSIKPILTLHDGEVHPFERVRTRAKAVQRMREIIETSGPYVEAAVLHATTPQEMEALASFVQPLSPNTSVIKGTIGPIIGTYTGPGVLGVATLRE
jgi:DegV family protein with EDD domain